jgi:hypothetical protein
MAGRRSAARSALAEAAAQFQKGLNQLELLPDTPERNRQELELQCALGAVLIALKGFAAPETGQVYVCAQALWEKLGSPTEFLHLPFGQSFHHVVRAEFDLAQRFDENLLRLGHQRNDSVGLVLGHHSSGRTLFYRGRFASSRSHQEEALRFTMQSPSARSSVRPGSALAWEYWHIWDFPCSVSAIPTKHWHGAMQRSPRRGSWPIRRLWL